MNENRRQPGFLDGDGMARLDIQVTLVGGRKASQALMAGEPLSIKPREHVTIYPTKRVGRAVLVYDGRHVTERVAVDEVIDWYRYKAAVARKSSGGAYGYVKVRVGKREASL